MSSRSPDGSQGTGGAPAGDEPATLQQRVEAVDAGAGELPPIHDPVALITQLDASGRFHRDGAAGRLYHAGMVSLRENVETDSLHVVVDDNVLSAHIDAVSPLHPPGRSAGGYSVARAAAHNLAGMAEDAIALARGRKGDHDSRLDVEWAPGEPVLTPQHAGLLDPGEAAWSVQLEARFGAALDEARLRTALGAAFGSATFDREPFEVADCADDDALDAARSRLHTMAIAAGDHPPLHACLARTRTGDVLMLTLNHAACDGFGALRVLRAIGRAYAGDRDRQALSFLAGAQLPVRPLAAYVPPLHERVRKRAVERVRDALSRPAQLAADEPRDDSGVGFELVALSEAQTRRLRAVDPAPGATNALAAALHLAIASWNAEHDEPGRQIGVLIAADLRPDDWREEMIGNISLNARVATARRNRSGAAAALRAIAAQTERSERERTGTALIAALRRNGLLELWAKQSTVVLRPLTTNHTVDAALLCDLGVVDGEPWFGDGAGEIAELWFSVPSRSPLSVSIGAVTVGGRLNLTLRYPRCLFSPAAARRFAQRYAERLRALGAAR